jgi:hypothetical protein
VNGLFEYCLTAQERAAVQEEVRQEKMVAARKEKEAQHGQD